MDSSSSIQRPRLRDHIVPQHQIERGDDDLALLLRLRHPNSRVTDIMAAYDASNAKCTYCGFVIQNIRGDTPIFKIIFNHFRLEHYIPLCNEDPSNSDKYYDKAIDQHENKYWDMRRCKSNVDDLKNDTDMQKNHWSSYQWQLSQANHRYLLAKKEYDRLQDPEAAAENIDNILNAKLANYEEKKDRYNRHYSFLQQAVIIENRSYIDYHKHRKRKYSGDVLFSTDYGRRIYPADNRRLGANVSRSTSQKQSDRRKLALYKVGKEFLFTDLQLGYLFSLDIKDIKLSMARGLDLYYGGIDGYPDWMKRAIIRD